MHQQRRGDCERQQGRQVGKQSVHKTRGDST
jgi:hypothetical protein